MSLSRYFDNIAIALSAVCILHCLALPFMIAGLPLAAIVFGEDAHFHGFMLWLVVPTSVAGFTLGYRLHTQLPVVILGVFGMLVLVVAGLWGHDRWAVSAEVTVTVIGSVVLASAHWLNFRGVRAVHRHCE